MFRWLLIFVFAVQISLPMKGVCGAGELRSTKAECCQVDHESPAKSCCHDKQVPSKTQQPVNTDCGDQSPCCGCCHVQVLFCWLPDLNFRFEASNVDRVDLLSDSLSGITHAPPTPPPNSDGVC